MRPARYIALLFLLLDSCIEPFNVQVATRPSLVVDGLITDQLGPQVVKLFNAKSLEDQLDVVDWAQGATVTIVDELGVVTKLKERTIGNYVSDTTFKGVVGKTYTLHVTSSEGETYESDPEKLLPVGDIDSVYTEFVQKESPLFDFHGQSQNGFNVFVNSKVLPEQEGMVRWRWTGTFEIQTFPELKTKASNTVVIVMLPDPPPCSGYIVPRGGGLTYYGPCKCCHCWVTQFANGSMVSDQQFISNNTITHQQVAFIEANRRFLYSKYYLEVEQLSVSQAVYNYWGKVAAQEVSGSNLFQTPPAPTIGNVHLVSGTTPVLGIFSASAVKKKHLELTKDNVPYAILPIDTIPASCLSVYPNTTNTKPLFW